MEVTEERKFQNSKELLKACMKKACENKSDLSGGNKALYPTIIIMLGKNSKIYTKHIKNTLDDNWYNSPYLKYVCFEKEDDVWTSSVLENQKRNTEVQWQTVDAAPQDVFQRAVMEMLGQDEQIFDDFRSVKMEFIMDATEKESAAYYDFCLEITHGLKNNQIKTFYLMIDENPIDGKKEASQKMWKYLLDKREYAVNKCATTYVLSNFLASGALWGEDKIWENYRLVADIILLSGNSGSDREYVKNLHNGIKTASYGLVEKPTDKIVYVSLSHLLGEMKQREEEHFSKELSEQSIRERLEIKGNEEFPQAEALFKEKIIRNLPKPGDLQYLPSAEKTFKLQKMREVTEKEADFCTMGVWSLFVQEKYLRKVEQYLANEEEKNYLVEQIRKLLYENFSFLEVLKMRSQKELIKQMFEKELQFRGVSGETDYKEELHERAVYTCKKHFYANVKKILIEEFEDMLEKASAYEEMYQQCISELAGERMILNGKNEQANEVSSIKTLYSGEVRQYVAEHQKNNSHESAFPQVFDIRLTKEEFLYHIWQVFNDFIKKDVYGYDFEKELSVRMGNMTEIQLQIYVQKELQRNLESRRRLWTETSISYKNCSFYLINNDADYARHLANLEGNGRDFMLFDLNRTDRIEQVEIYNITNPEYMVFSEENQHDNEGI